MWYVQIYTSLSSDLKQLTSQLLTSLSSSTALDMTTSLVMQVTLNPPDYR